MRRGGRRFLGGCVGGVDAPRVRPWPDWNTRAAGVVCAAPSAIRYKCRLGSVRQALITVPDGPAQATRQWGWRWGPRLIPGRNQPSKSRPANCTGNACTRGCGRAWGYRGASGPPSARGGQQCCKCGRLRRHARDGGLRWGPERHGRHGFLKACVGPAAVLGGLQGGAHSLADRGRRWVGKDGGSPAAYAGARRGGPGREGRRCCGWNGPGLEGSHGRRFKGAEG